MKITERHAIKIDRNRIDIAIIPEAFFDDKQEFLSFLHEKASKAFDDWKYCKENLILQKHK